MATPMPVIPTALGGISTPVTITLPVQPPTIVKIPQEANKNGPEAKFQVTQQLLYENEFEGHAYISAHLQRLQNGLYVDDNLHTKDSLHVTFVAVTFVLHAERSITHRFESLLIEVTARSTDEKQLRFLKYAPHAAYGRMSTESLKWNFQLGASVGVTKCPVNVNVNPSVSYEKDKVVGTMMKIQGSTRSTFHRAHASIDEHRIADTKLVWSMEENAQQESGLPREFTFVFLIERSSEAHCCQKPSDHKLLHLPHLQADGTTSPPLEEKEDPDGVLNYHCLDHKYPEEKDSSISLHEVALPLTPNHSGNHTHNQGPDSYDQVFMPIQFSFNVKPIVSGTVNAAAPDIPRKPQHTIVYGEVGQRFPTDGINGEHVDHVIDGFYNFAKLPGNFEDLMELPGSSVTSVEPTLPNK